MISSDFISTDIQVPLASAAAEAAFDAMLKHGPTYWTVPLLRDSPRNLTQADVIDLYQLVVSQRDSAGLKSFWEPARHTCLEFLFGLDWAEQFSRGEPLTPKLERFIQSRPELSNLRLSGLPVLTELVAQDSELDAMLDYQQKSIQLGAKVSPSRDQDQFLKCLTYCCKNVRPQEIISISLGSTETYEFRPNYLRLPGVRFHIAINRDLWTWSSARETAHDKYKEVHESGDALAFDFVGTDLDVIDDKTIQQLFESVMTNEARILVVDGIAYGHGPYKKFYEAAVSSGLKKEQLCYYHAHGQILDHESGNLENAPLPGGSLRVHALTRAGENSSGDVAADFSHFTSWKLDVKPGLVKPPMWR